MKRITVKAIKTTNGNRLCCLFTSIMKGLRYTCSFEIRKTLAGGYMVEVNKNKFTPLFSTDLNITIPVKSYKTNNNITRFNLDVDYDKFSHCKNIHNNW